ncbi:MAG: DNA-binding GntR family transcriptional regulator [Oceanicoccus sp.]
MLVDIKFSQSGAKIKRRFVIVEAFWYTKNRNTTFYLINLLNNVNIVYQNREVVMADTISDQAYEGIRESIISGELAPGRFLVEQELASTLGVSRTPVKSALRRLEVEGLVESEGNKRARVREFSEEETQEILEIRALLESYASKRAARFISDDQLLRLETLATAMEAISEKPRTEAENLKQFSKLNDEFHKIILQASGSAHLQNLMKPIFQMHILLMGRFQHRIEHNLKRSCWHHREIIAALADHNEEWAMIQMQTHLFAAGSWKPEEGSTDHDEY